jgi:hypothetical protein
MSVESEQNRPNEFGFAGAATAPEPAKDAEPVAPVEEADAESAAVPSGDITGSITEAMKQSTEHGDDDEESGAG